jgi:NADH:ubiquinone oxidoreductase subunit C
MIYINFNTRFFWNLINIFIFNRFNGRFYLRVTKGCVRVRLIKMSRQSYYVKMLLTIYKKLVSSIFTKKSSQDTVFIVSKDNKITYSLEKNSLMQFKLLNDICVVDYPEKINRFELNYNLLSVKYSFRIFLKTFTQSYIQSLTHIYNSAN